MAHQLGPPLPRQHLHAQHDNRGNSKSQQQLSHQDIIEAHPFLMNVLSKMYMAHHCLQLSTETRFTSFQLFHRFLSHYVYYNHIGINPNVTNSIAAIVGEGSSSLSIQQKEEVSDFASAAIFLSCKLCNEHRRIRDVINIQKVFYMNDDNINLSSLHDYSKVEPPALDENYWRKKEEMVKAEQLLLRMINFDVTIYQPHRIMIVVWEELVSLNQTKSDKGNDNCYYDDNYDDKKQSLHSAHERWKRVLFASWRRLNDSLFHVDSLMCHSSWLACAALSLAMEEERVTVQEASWWEWLDVNVVQLNETRDKLLEAAKIPRIECMHANM